MSVLSYTVTQYTVEKVWLEEKMSNYPEYIKKYVRLRLDLDDTKENDDYINMLTPSEVFDIILEWNGICGYSETITIWIKDIFGIDLGVV